MKHFISLLILLLCATGAIGWSSYGHYLVTQIALDQMMVQNGMEQIIDDLAGFSQFFPNHSEPLSASVWFDNLRSYGINAFRTWHYIDIPYYPDGLPFGKSEHNVSDVNVVWALKQSYESLMELNDNGCDFKPNLWNKNFMLRVLLHLVGDIHQPFHNIERFRKYHEGDMGGNRYHVWYQWKFTTLHGFWDTCGGLFIDHLELPLSEYDVSQIKEEAAKLINTHDYVEVDNKFDPKLWSLEAYEIGKQFGYPYSGTFNGMVLTDKYINNTRKICKEQIVKAGYRLAHTLDSIYRDHEESCYPWDYCYQPVDFAIF